MRLTLGSDSITLNGVHEIKSSMFQLGGATLDVGGTGSDHFSGSNGTYTMAGNGGSDHFDFTGLGSAKFTGGTGADVFDYHAGPGNVTVTDFKDGVDHISLGTLSFSSPHIADSAAGAVITSPGETGSMTLTGITAHQLTHSDFII